MKNLKRYAITILTAFTIALNTTNAHAHGFQLFEFSRVMSWIRELCTHTKNKAKLFRKNFFAHMIAGLPLFKDNSKIPKYRANVTFLDDYPDTKPSSSSLVGRSLEPFWHMRSIRIQSKTLFK